jgi:hypothetical protein
MATTPPPQPEPPAPPHPPEVPMPPAEHEPPPEGPIEPNAADPRDDAYGVDDSIKVTTGDEEDDSQDLVDHMRDMLHSGRIDLDAYRGERSDDGEDGEDGMLGDGRDAD